MTGGSAPRTKTSHLACSLHSQASRGPGGEKTPPCALPPQSADLGPEAEGASRTSGEASTALSSVQENTGDRGQAGHPRSPQHRANSRWMYMQKWRQWIQFPSRRQPSGLVILVGKFVCVIRRENVRNSSFSKAHGLAETLAHIYHWPGNPLLNQRRFPARYHMLLAPRAFSFPGGSPPTVLILRLNQNLGQRGRLQRV